MNNIGKNQNTNEMLDLLFSARVYMNKASYLKNMEFILIFIIVCINFLRYFTINLSIIEWIIVLGTIIIGILEFLIKQNIELGALIKQYIDLTLYEMPNIDELSERKVKEAKYKAITSNKKFYIEQVNNDGNSEKRGVRNWYSVENTLELNDAIIECQKENSYWDKKLVKKYMFFLVILGTVILITSYICTNSWLIRVSSIINAVIIFKEIINCFKHITFSEKLETKFNYYNKCSDKKDIILDIQNDIFERRKFLIVPDIFHKISRKELHEIWNEIKKKN